MKLLTPAQASRYLKVSEFTLAGWRSKKQGPAFIKTGRSIKYAESDLDAYLKRQTVKTN